jgi:hypothetical protein
MSYHMRFILTDGAPPSLEALEATFKAADPSFFIERDAADVSCGDLYHGDEVYAEIEINLRGDPVCDEDIEEFQEELEKHDDPNRLLVLDVLARATGMVVLRILLAGHENQQHLNVLWDWLFESRSGLLQVDSEGFFDREKRVVSLL